MPFIGVSYGYSLCPILKGNLCGISLQMLTFILWFLDAPWHADKWVKFLDDCQTSFYTRGKEFQNGVTNVASVILKNHR